jgi:hypothetical protein
MSRKNPIQLLSVQTVVILVLLIIVFLQRCGTGSSNTPAPKRDTVRVVDTQWVTKVDTFYGKPKPSAPPKVDTSWRDSIKLKDSTYKYLFDRYIELGDRYYSRHTYQQKFKIDTIGSITVKDTVVSNVITGRSLTYDLKYPVIKETTTITIHEPYKSTRQLYVGGGIWGNQKAPISGANVGLLYKDRKDRVFGGNIGVFNSELTYGVSSYWKIKLR